MRAPRGTRHDDAVGVETGTPTPTPAAGATPEHRGGPPRVLLVDQAPQRRTALRLLLEDANMSVFDLPDSSQALVVAEVVQPDVAVIDLRLPAVGGLLLTSQLRATGAPVQILWHTDADRSFMLPIAYRAGALDVLVSSAAAGTVLEAVRTAVALSRVPAFTRNARHAGPVE